MSPTISIFYLPETQGPSRALPVVGLWMSRNTLVLYFKVTRSGDSKIPTNNVE